MIRYRNGAYEVVVHVGLDPITGKPRRVSRSVRTPRTRRTPRHVLDLEAELRGQVRTGEHGGPDRSVGELLDAWVRHLESRRSPKTVHDYRFVADRYIKPHIGKLPLAKLTPARIDALYTHLQARGGRDGKALSATTVRQVHAVLRSALSTGIRWKWIATNPATVADAPRPVKKERDLPARDELAALMAKANDDLRALIALAAGTGCRRGELCGLRWSDVNWKDHSVRVARAAVPVGWDVVIKEPKTGKGRTVPIGPNLTEMLKVRKKEYQRRGLKGDGYVLSDDYLGLEPLHPEYASKRFARLAKSQGLPIRLHGLRHLAATWALQAGIAPNDVAASQGWSSTKLLFDTYGHAMSEGVRRVGDELDPPL